MSRSGYRHCHWRTNYRRPSRRLFMTGIPRLIMERRYRRACILMNAYYLLNGVRVR